ncbi:hypothetical protein VP01_1049g3 [Puccinia sorghi]|uniref:SigF-like NTF2-like domain-containing protein n=1 Tax=Puccinia sorghi TaxID=27349 RepID=A0A0L6VU81_9BASI|nr:hypothetical protein VP01_1049g3 [Puccinia sorghi]
MDDPVKEVSHLVFTSTLPEVVRKITEPYAATEIVRNVDKYFTDDAYLLYPLINQPHTKNGKARLMGIYKLMLKDGLMDQEASGRVLTINNRIEFHAVMFSEDRLQATLGTSPRLAIPERKYREELTETLQGRFIPIWFRLRFLSRIDLRQESDGKYRICKSTRRQLPERFGAGGIGFHPRLGQFPSDLEAHTRSHLGHCGQLLLEERLVWTLIKVSTIFPMSPTVTAKSGDGPAIKRSIDHFQSCRCCAHDHRALRSQRDRQKRGQVNDLAVICKYFTEDAFLLYPMFNQPHTTHGKENLKGIYKLLFNRVFSINNKIEFHALMFSEDRLNATVGKRRDHQYTSRPDLTETVEARFCTSIKAKLHFITRVDMRKEGDGKYRICRQEDNYPNDLRRSGIPLYGLSIFTATYKIIAGTLVSCVGRFLLEKGWFGP